MRGLRTVVLVTSAVRLRIAVLVTAAIGLGLLVLGGLLLAGPVSSALFAGPNCAHVCGLQWLLLGVLVAMLGVAASFAAVILAVIDAGQRGDWLSVCLVSLPLVLSVGAIVYLIIVVSVINGPGGPIAIAPPVPAAIWLAVIGGAFSCVLVTSLSPVVYSILRDLTTVHRIALVALAALVIIVPFLVAPPWSVYNTATDVPVLALSAQSLTVPCTGGSHPFVTLKNTGSAPLQWAAQSSQQPLLVPVTISPSSGSLRPNMTQPVTVTFQSTVPNLASFFVQFKSDGGDIGVLYRCT